MKNSIILPILALVVCITMQTQKSLAQPGSLDPTFNPASAVFMNGVVSSGFSKSVQQPDGKIIIAGDIVNFNGTVLNKNLIRLNVNGTLDPDFNTAWLGYGAITTMALQADGKLIIGGIFESYSGITRKGIARINTDGSLDNSFDPGNGFAYIINGGINPGQILSISLQANGQIIVGGTFGEYNGISRKGIARLNADGSLDNGFDPGASILFLDPENGFVPNTALQSDGKIILSGFTTGSDFEILRLNTDGSVDNSFTSQPEFISRFNQVFVQPDDKLIVEGWLTWNNGWASLFRLNADGSVDSSFNPGGGVSYVPFGVLDIKFQTDGKIILAGNFDHYSNAPYTINNSTETPSGMIRLLPDGIIDTGFTATHGIPIFGEEIGKVPFIELQNNQKIVVGINTLSDAYIRRLNADGSLDLQTADGPNFVVRSIALQADNKIIIGGDFITYNGITRLKHIARIYADGSLDESFNPDSSINYPKTVSIQPDGKILLGGSGFFGQSPIVRLNVDGSIDNSFNSAIPGSNNYYASIISSIIVQNDGKIIVGGSFPNDVVCYRLNTDGSIDNSFNTGFIPNGYFIQSIAIQADNKIILSGNFASYNNITIKNIIRLNNDGSIDNTFNADIEMLDFTQGINQIALQQDGKIIINGFSQNHFNTILKRLNTDGTGDASFNPDFEYADGDGFMLATKFLIQGDGKIIMCALRNWGDGLTGLFRLNVDGSLDQSFQCGLGFNNFPSSQVNSMFMQTDGNLVIAGHFGGYDIIPINNLARILNTTCPGLEIPSIIISTLPAGSICAGTEVIFTAQSVNGGTVPRYQWQKNGIDIPAARYISYVEDSPVTGDTITCILFSNAHCVAPYSAISNSIIISVVPTVTPSISIALTTGSIPVCEGQQLTFTATPVNGGSYPIYQWKLNDNQDIGNNSPVLEYSAFSINDVVSCTLTSDAPCASPSTITSNGIAVNTIIPISWYLDADGDGYYTSSSVTSCSSPGAGYTSNVIIGSGDCDDSNPAIHPNATEVAGNNIDDNCNGEIDELPYCIPAIYYSCSGVGIEVVTLGSITNNSHAVPCGNGYFNYSQSFSTSHAAGSTVNFSIQLRENVYQKVNIYVDYNNDGDFDDADEAVALGIEGYLGNPAAGSFIISAEQPLGNYRVRVISNSAYQFTLDACNSFSGEAEDYTLTVTPYEKPPYCTAVIDVPCIETWLQEVTLGTILNNNYSCNGGYSDFSATYTTDALPGGAVDYSLNCAGGINQYANIFIDFNDDGDFFDSGEQVATDFFIAANSVTSGSFIVPGTQSVGFYRLRIVTDAEGYPSPTACHSSVGELEDYTLHILPVYCTPTIDNLCIQGTINNVELGTISNSTACEEYADFSATIATTNYPGQTVNYNISTNDYSGNQVNIYIDYNNNGSFTDIGENIASSVPMNIFNVATGTFLIPAALPFGSYRIRITFDYEGSIADPCHVVNGEVEDYTLIVQPNTFTTLNLKLILEGLFDESTGLMKQAMDAGPAPQFGSGIADQLSVELLDEVSPHSTAYTFSNVDLHTDGTLTINTIPLEITGSYYIVIKHRNSIETWSSSAISFGVENPANYDFSISASQAYGENQKLISGVYAIYGGDVNQDGVVDAEDLIPVDNDAAGFTAGYLNTDCNGDGLIDSSDLMLVGTNSDSFIEAMFP